MAPLLLGENMHPLLEELYAYHHNASMIIDEVKILLMQLTKNTSPLKENEDLFRLLSVLHDEKERLHHQNEELIRKRLVATDVAIHPRILDLERDHDSFYKIADHLKLLVDSELSRAEILAIIEDYIRKYYDHIDSEENIFFPMADKHLTEQDWQEIESQWQG
ncbi:hemerythrin domain-containing protein [uncultured Shewanella sp.]|uniref:hemerythrin domain-containing protein n=1 Tax=uncultured Shewanella sp. TaxID=173975 RepID=UPI0026090F94|nr:hemerythrin domain-containing protein [uncultured Shewanella sp.]